MSVFMQTHPSITQKLRFSFFFYLFSKGNMKMQLLKK